MSYKSSVFVSQHELRLRISTTLRSTGTPVIKLEARRTQLVIVRLAWVRHIRSRFDGPQALAGLRRSFHTPEHSCRPSPQEKSESTLLAQRGRKLRSLSTIIKVKVTPQKRVLQLGIDIEKFLAFWSWEIVRDLSISSWAIKTFISSSKAMNCRTSVLG